MYFLYKYNYIGLLLRCLARDFFILQLHLNKTILYKLTSTNADAKHQEENPMRKKCLKAIVQEGHNICTSEWQMLSAILKAKYCIVPL